MEQNRIETLLNELAQRTEEPVNQKLSENIKGRIPEKMDDFKGLNNINIIIDLRINKLAAAAIIIISTLLVANFFARSYQGDINILQDSGYLLSYVLGRDRMQDSYQLVAKTKYDTLVSMGVEAVYYGSNAKKSDPNSILLHWKVGENIYRIMFTDLSEKEVSAQELINLQSKMLKSR